MSIDLPPFKFLVEYKLSNRPYSARFTSEVHARKFIKNQKRNGIFNCRMYSLKEDGSVGKEIKVK